MKVVVKVASRNTRTEQLKSPYPTPPHPTYPTASSFFHAKEKTLSFWAWHNMCACVCVSAIVYNKKEEVATVLANPNQEEEELFLLFHLFPPSDIQIFRLSVQKK